MTRVHDHYYCYQIIRYYFIFFIAIDIPDVDISDWIWNSVSSPTSSDSANTFRRLGRSIILKVDIIVKGERENVFLGMCLCPHFRLWK